MSSGKRMSRDQFAELIAAVVRGVPRDLTPEEGQILITGQHQLPAALREALVATAKRLAEAATTKCAGGTFETLLTTCRQDWVHKDITEEHFPLVDDGTGHKEILEYGFDQTVTGYEAADELKRLGFKLVGMRRAMEHVSSRPDAQKAYPLIVLGARWRGGGSVCVPCFSWDGSERYFNLYWLRGRFGTDCRFLVVRDKEEGETKKHVIDTDAAPVIPAGWKVQSHQKLGQMEWYPTKVSLYLSKRQQNGRAIDGHELRTELTSQLVLNANVLDYLLAHPELIPGEWKGKSVYFWGTIYRGTAGSLCVRSLCWRDDKWDWHFSLVDFDWNYFQPAVVSVA